MRRLSSFRIVGLDEVAAFSVGYNCRRAACFACDHRYACAHCLNDG